jgi:hypothetical protein
MSLSRSKDQISSIKFRGDFRSKDPKDEHRAMCFWLGAKSVPAMILFLGVTTSFGQGAQADDIRAVLDAQVQAWNRGDIEGFMDGYWRSDSLLFTSGGQVERGWTTTLKKYKMSPSFPRRAPGC